MVIIVFKNLRLIYYSRGLYDPKLGPRDSKDNMCITCGLNYYNCPGHIGHIELCVPVIIFVYDESYINLMPTSP